MGGIPGQRPPGGAPGVFNRAFISHGARPASGPGTEDAQRATEKLKIRDIQDQSAFPWGQWKPASHGITGHDGGKGLIARPDFWPSYTSQH